MIIEITKGEISKENLSKIGELIEQGYTMGIDSPMGVNWTICNGE